MILSYQYLFQFFFFSLILSAFLYFISYFIVKKDLNASKTSAYECGFSPYDDARKVFRISFYLYALIFLIFDLEAVFIFPWVKTYDIQFSFGFWVMIDFIFELVIGFLYLWIVGAFDHD